MEKTTLMVKGMTCMGCVRSVKNLLEQVPGVAGVEITLDNGQVVISYDSTQATLGQLKNAINDGGYEVIG